MHFLYVTSNERKFQEAQLVLAPSIQLERKNLELQEIQGTLEEIVTYKALQAWEQLRVPLLVEDVSLQLESLNGFPGPYVKFFLQTVGENGLWEITRALGNSRVETSCYVAYIDERRKPQVFCGHIRGRIVPPKGELRHGKVSYNTVFQPDGYEKTFGEMSMEEHAQMSHRFHALQDFRSSLICS